MEIQTAARGYFSSKLLLLFAIAQRYYKGQTHNPFSAGTTIYIIVNLDKDCMVKYVISIIKWRKYSYFKAII